MYRERLNPQKHNDDSTASTPASPTCSGLLLRVTIPVKAYHRTLHLTATTTTFANTLARRANRHPEMLGEPHPRCNRWCYALVRARGGAIPYEPQRARTTSAPASATVSQPLSKDESGQPCTSNDDDLRQFKSYKGRPTTDANAAV
ncbi:hypothetical protein D9611_006115 [Ephemerocybe angulata]|uniref:Uncharacterized protein n=1 Tax=Ephemerocybe angulata TaxID=980116 RepID=A0A8H5FLB7_9AGAR|nr:hypothetical protein D9611_006115 [Tulosesus angulatus]